jgi:hypothetical protein
MATGCVGRRGKRAKAKGAAHPAGCARRPAAKTRRVVATALRVVGGGLVLVPCSLVPSRTALRPRPARKPVGKRKAAQGRDKAKRRPVAKGSRRKAPTAAKPARGRKIKARR